jgi:hypothetical protein
MAKFFEQYEHHGKLVWVRSALKDKHRRYCLCYSCTKFKPNQEDNCPLAEGNYQYCVQHDLTLPVWTCPKFEEKPDAE